MKSWWKIVSSTASSIRAIKLLQEPNRLRLGEVTPAVVLQGLLAGCALDQRLSSEIKNLYNGSTLRYFEQFLEL